MTLSWLLLASAGARAQKFTISGRVVDKDNRSAPGVRVTVQRGAAIIQSQITGEAGSYTLTFPAGDPVTIIYSGGGWLPTKVHNLSGRIDHSLGKVLSRMTETATLTPAEADDVGAAMKYFAAYPALYAREMADYKNISLPNPSPWPDKKIPFDRTVYDPPRKVRLPDNHHGFAQYAGRDHSDRLIRASATGDPILDPPSASADLEQGAQLYEQRRYGEAAERFAKATAAAPKLFRAQFSLGLAYEALGRYKEAAAAYGVAVTLAPEDSIDFKEASYNLGNSLASAGQHREAIEVYRQLAQRAHISELYYNLGLSHVALGEEQEAIEAFRKAIQIKPDYAKASYNLGVALSRTERYDEAIAAFKGAVRVKPDYAEAHYNLGLAYYLLDDQAGLMEQQKVLQRLDPKLASELAKRTGK